LAQLYILVDGDGCGLAVRRVVDRRLERRRAGCVGNRIADAIGNGGIEVNNIYSVRQVFNAGQLILRRVKRDFLYSGFGEQPFADRA